ncbi:MAG: rhodanese-like domain-containing protein [Rhodospirillales bacterium]|jgi:rhodanese-related sulfurtransferase
MALKRGFKALLAEADAVATVLTVEEAEVRLNDPNTVVVDIRDIRELEREGMVPGARHAPRGMLEFWAAPDSPYHKEWMADDGKTYVFYCQSAWRSALAVKDLMDMGASNVAHIKGGFKAWKEAGKSIESRSTKKD